ncbi:trimethylamine--corrinoid methyltransferase [Acetohalobium arabaticum]|uniref:Methyltransferase n=1 Tax=Acetohalobium arabaticum (strain ATCC 49924 / DSM 5501 / Z-7288) TaxID=574087 RepID=D9QPL8_ACEAZ|nr:trimethylamine--corrinoid methyltransferase [Acetohalobium arabaticum]ADL12459.1 trimethylamine:corrinoid methyltransferase [Acetohalobium arabaticum DSM 5501]
MIKRNFLAQDILSNNEIEKIHNASMKILESTGIDILQEEAQEIFEEHGAKVEGKRVYLPRKLVEDALDRAPSSFTLHARNPENNVVIGGNNSVLAPSSGVPFVTDLDNGRRDATFEDYVNLTKIASDSDHIDVLGGLIVEPTDVADEKRHAKMFYAGAKYSDKCLVGSRYGTKSVQDCLEMARILFGEDEIIDDRAVLISIINTNSPLQLDNRMLSSLIEYAKYNQATVITPAAMAGSTGPMSIAGTLTLQNAEAIAGIVLTQLINPGAPVVYGCASTITDMKTAGLAIGSPEYAKFVGASAQLARYYDIPSRAGGSLTDSVMADAQAGYEAMMMFMSSINHGVNFILHSLGILDSYMMASYEKFIIDNEIVGMVKNYQSGIEVNEEMIAEEVINKVGPAGHFLEDAHTLQHMRDFRAPEISNRAGYNGEDNLITTAERANEKWKDTLANFEEPYLDSVIEERLTEYMESL